MAKRPSTGTGPSGTAQARSIVGEQDLLHCPVCTNEYTAPKMLGCLHSFCFECLQNSLSQSQIKAGHAFLCPICRTQCVVPMRGVKAIKSNIYLVTLQDFYDRKTLDKTQECEGCDSRKLGKKKCIQCNDWLCAQCCSMHTKVKVTKDHVLVSASELLSGQYDDLIKESFDSLICSKHGEALQLYCTDPSCQAPVCTVCKTTLGHDGHTAIELNQQATAEGNAIINLMPGMDRGIRSMEAKVANLKRDDRQTSYVRKKIHKAINTRMEEVVEVLMKQIGTYAENLHQEVDKIVKDHKRELSKELEQSEFTLDAMYHAKGFTESLLDFRRAEELVSMSREVKTRLEEFQTSVDVAPPSWRQPRLHPAEKVSDVDIKKLFGDLTFEGEVVKCVLLKAFSAKTPYDDRECALCDLSIDDRSNLCVVDRDNKRVKIFDTNGQLKLITGEHMFRAPNRIQVLKQTGRMLVKDEKSLVLLHPDGTIFNKFAESLKQPVGLAQNSKNEVLVTDWMNGTVVFCDELGVKLRSFLCASEAPGYITTSYDDSVIISDWKQNLVKVFDSQGQFLHQYGGEAGDGNGQLNHPYGVCTDKYGHIIIADTWNNRIVMVGGDGRPLGDLLGADDGIKWPQAVAVDSKDRLIVVEQGGVIKVYQYVA